MAEKHIFISLGSNLGNRLDNLTKALILLETIKLILIGDFFNKENLIKLFRLLPVPEMKTAVFTFLKPINFTIYF